MNSRIDDLPNTFRQIDLASPDYLVNPRGVVISKGKPLNPYWNGGRVCVCIGEQNRSIGRLVAEAFLDDERIQKAIETKTDISNLVVNHIDEDPWNNNLENLRWVTRGELYWINRESRMAHLGEVIPLTKGSMTCVKIDWREHDYTATFFMNAPIEEKVDIDILRKIVKHDWHIREFTSKICDLMPGKFNKDKRYTYYFDIPDRSFAAYAKPGDTNFVVKEKGILSNCHVSKKSGKVSFQRLDERKLFSLRFVVQIVYVNRNYRFEPKTEELYFNI